MHCRISWEQLMGVPLPPVSEQSMDPLSLVNLGPLMELGGGRSEITIGLIDGPVALDHPDLSADSIRNISDISSNTCARPDSYACMHGTFIAGILCAKRGSVAPAICPGCTLLIHPIFPERQS